MTIFTYDQSRLVGSSVDEQIDGSFNGPLYRVSGPPFGTTLWTGVSTSQVGDITIQFTTTNTATVMYTVGDVTVPKAVQKQVFGVVPTCAPTTSSRSTATNYQDLGREGRDWGRVK